MDKFLNKNQSVTEIVLAIFVPPGMGSTVHKNRPSHGLALNWGEEKNYIFDDGTVCTVKKNDIIYLPKNSSYQVSTIASGEVYCINFQCADDEVFQPFVLHIKKAENVLQAYQAAEKAWRMRKAGAQFKCKSELYKVLYEMHKEYAAPYIPESKMNLIKPAVDYIHKHYTEELINVETLSEVCGISYEYFRRLFHKFYGYSPIKYINELKLKRAKELLASGFYSVSEAAIQSGFTDVSFFSRYFKKKVGVSPSEYRLNGITTHLHL